MDKTRKITSLPLTIERRKFERVPLRLSLQFVRVSQPTDVIDCFTENLCGEGVYFVSCHSLGVGDWLELDLHFPPHNSGRNLVNLHLRCQARVMRVDPASQGLGFGIACHIEKYTILFGDADLRRDLRFQSAKA